MPVQIGALVVVAVVAVAVTGIASLFRKSGTSAEEASEAEAVANEEASNEETSEEPCAECADAVAEEEFAERFEDITGMTLEDSIKLYEEQTGEELSASTVQTLFSDPVKAGEILMKDENLHTTYRNILNSNIPATAEAAEEAGFEKLPFMKSIFHNPFANSKWVGPNGHLEAVYDGNGDLVTSNSVKGTFNFFGPDNASGHTAADVKPYFEWGN